MKGISIDERAIELAHYIIDSKDTVRGAAKKFGISKSTVHKDVSERLKKINPSLAREVRRILDENKAERHIRGGMATKLKSRITTTARGIVFFVIMKILHLRIQNHSQLLEMPKSAKVRVMPINLPILASPLPGKEMLPLRKQLLKFFRQL